MQKKLEEALQREAKEKELHEEERERLRKDISNRQKELHNAITTIHSNKREKQEEKEKTAELEKKQSVLLREIKDVEDEKIGDKEIKEDNNDGLILANRYLAKYINYMDVLQTPSIISKN